MADAISRLRDILAREPQQERLAEAALLLAQAYDPTLDISAYLRQFDDWADHLNARFHDHAADAADAAERIEVLNGFLFDELGFAGDGEHFFDPRNSFLNSVIDRRLGIPISLSVVYIELGRRIGLPLEGVSFPGHFLVTLPVHHGAVVLDPYAEGASLELGDLERLLRHADREAPVDAAHIATLLAPASLSDILIRMLRNLKGIYWREHDPVEGLRIQDLLLAVAPDLAVEYRDRGILKQRLGQFSAAVEDFNDYLARQPDALDAELIRARIVELNRSPRVLH
ncbi:MAG: tetratricopeptide repeat protein [Gammaproteobacteria bacterium]|nr:tetratricopeptide repeat protein [Gammaproteobacteria bacterium]